MDGPTGVADSPDLAYCFLDTNILLHCRTFDEVEWPTVLGVTDACLVLAPIVVKELEKHRSEPKNDWLQTRARTLLTKLRPYLLDDHVARNEPITVPSRSHVTLLVIPHQPKVNWSKLNLDPTWNDDRLLASILQFKHEYPTLDVRFAARDTSFLAKATSYGVRLVDGEHIPEVERASTELERVRRELETYKNRIPRLEFGFYQGEKLSATLTRQRPVRDYEEQAAKDEVILALVESERTAIKSALASGRGKVADTTLEKYQQQCAIYLNRLAMTLKMKRSFQHGPTCRLSFGLTNIGTAAASDVDLKLEFPEGSFVIDASDIDDEVFGTVELPKRPVATWMIPPPPPRTGPYAGLLNSFSGLNASLIAPSIISRPPVTPSTGPRGPLCQLEGDRRLVWYEHPKLSQGTLWRLAPVFAYLPPATRGGFTIRWQLRADELPHPLEGKLQVRWAQQRSPESPLETSESTGD